MTKHEILVRALLEFYSELTERKFNGRWHLVDDMLTLDRAIKDTELTERQRLSINLVFGERREQREVAEILDIPQPNVSLHIRAAIRKIAKVYEKWEELDYA